MTAPLIHWTEDGEPREAMWRSESADQPPKRVVLADDRLTAAAAHRQACEGTAMLWRGDYQNMRQLLQALARRIDKRSNRSPPTASDKPGDAFHRHRQLKSQRARALAMLLLPLDADYGVPLRRAPDIRQACHEAFGPPAGPSVISLREVLGLIGAHEWRKAGVDVPGLGRIHPHYGVFAPIRNEYVRLVAEAPLPATDLAFDIGTGTGVLAAVLARRGVARVLATDQDPRALACARDNLPRLGLTDRVELLQADLFPAGQAPLIVCNPPWIPARPSSSLEHAVYDPASRMLRGFLAGLAEHLSPRGEAWLILSDIAEHLGLRTRDELLALFTAANLQVLGRNDIRPHHPRVRDAADPLHTARAAETTSLWRLGHATPS